MNHTTSGILCHSSGNYTDILYYAMFSEGSWNLALCMIYCLHFRNTTFSVLWVLQNFPFMMYVPCVTISEHLFSEISVCKMSLKLFIIRVF